MSSLKFRPHVESIWGLNSWRMRWKLLTERDSGGDPTRILAERQKACWRKDPARLIAKLAATLETFPCSSQCVLTMQISVNKTQQLSVCCQDQDN